MLITLIFPQKLGLPEYMSVRVKSTHQVLWPPFIFMDINKHIQSTIYIFIFHFDYCIILCLKHGFVKRKENIGKGKGKIRRRYEVKKATEFHYFCIIFFN